ncbi:hypothetical protein Cgig2_013694 [Carnegiea gigantea]|uniref:Uncharacterized protein n=1 Tax=Carnegiea gigantea TaxID=171969 RepID=A0A9Q1KE72_9CARY|nr:hypothetical protein Cgig2_013694 [Carnegiea gigantea]
MGKRPFLLSTDLPGARSPSWNEELVDAPLEDEHLDELSKEDEEVSHEVELVLVEATSAPGFDELGVERGLPCVPLASSSSGDLMQGVDLTEDARGGGVLAARPEGSAWFKTRHDIGNLFEFPRLILSGDIRHHPAINKGQEARELQMTALHLGTDQPLRNVPTG